MPSVDSRAPRSPTPKRVDDPAAPGDPADPSRARAGSGRTHRVAPRSRLGASDGASTRALRAPNGSRFAAPRPPPRPKMPAMDPALRDADKENAAIARAIRAVAGGSLNLGPGGGTPRETPFETRPSRRRRPAAAPAAGEITAFDGNRPRTPPRAERRRSTSNGLRTDLEAPKRVDASAPASPWAPGSVGCDAWGADADVDAAREPRTKRREKKSDGSSGDAASSGAGAAPGAEAGAGGGAPAERAARRRRANAGSRTAGSGSNPRLSVREGRSSRRRESARGARTRPRTPPGSLGRRSRASGGPRFGGRRTPRGARERRPLGERRAASRPRRASRETRVRNPPGARGPPPSPPPRRRRRSRPPLSRSRRRRRTTRRPRPCGGASRRRRPRRRRRRRR